MPKGYIPTYRLKLQQEFGWDGNTFRMETAAEGLQRRRDAERMEIEEQRRRMEEAKQNKAKKGKKSGSGKGRR